MTTELQLESLQELISSRQAVVSVIGLGYVGLAVACEFARTGFTVIGVDIDQGRVATINAGRCPIEGEEPGLAELLAEVVAEGKLKATFDYTDIHDANVLLICVDTPVDDDHLPRYNALRSAACSIGNVLHPGMLVIVESTVSPGTTTGVVQPFLEEASGLRAGVDFGLGACPERVMPGKLLNNLRTVSRVCGGISPETAAVMRALYRQVVHAELDATDVVTAELVKTAENAYRDVQIAFANEVALVCEANGADVWKVRELVNKSPGRHMLLPGAGVGGHCIPKDPWLLAHAAGDQRPVRLIPAARAVNDAMPYHVRTLLEDGLAKQGRVLPGSEVTILGYSYLENSDDTRNSPSAKLVEALVSQGAHVRVHDSFVPPYQASLESVVEGADAIVIMVAHDEYRNLNFQELSMKMKGSLLIDGRHVVHPADAASAGLTLQGIGLGGPL